MNKVFTNADEAIFDIQDGDTLMLGGFGLCGIPENCIDALVRKGVKDLICISNNAGVDGFGLGKLLVTHQIKKMMSSYVGENAATRIQMAAMGVPAFYTPAGYGTEIAEGKEVREFNGKMHLMEYALHARFAIVKAWRGDTSGNLVFRKTTRNFSTSMAKAGDITIAEVEQLVEPGELDPDCVHVAGVYVHRIFQGRNYEKRIERRTVRIQ